MSSSNSSDVGASNCDHPPFCHVWWLTSDANMPFLLVIIFSLSAGVVALLSSLVVLTGLILMFQSLWTSFRERAGSAYQRIKQDDTEDVETVTKSQARRTALKWFCCGIWWTLFVLAVVACGAGLWWLKMVDHGSQNSSGGEKKHQKHADTSGN
eukprot:gnl/MRDRNA2_/MRDRNA2_118128_c0_seq1.p1 gnl/MRDRNA2_/MRDRNA2_118128_c0~~gnl/MRDRNA2_/MRDRNA2_118128_c0_seq1.p1  ORF type:complete len:154 (-),score=17.77 gnl/MRDRNA2_/MRDRNA2_118128_c0_seq1:57-518(-)